MAKSIEINYNTGSGYEVLYPKTIASLVDGALTSAGGTVQTLTVTGQTTLEGNVRLKPRSSNYGSKLNFGDGDYCYIAELTDDKLEIKGNVIDLKSSNVQVNGSPIGSGGGDWVPQMVTHVGTGGRNFTIRFPSVSGKSLRFIQYLVMTAIDNEDNFYINTVSEDINSVRGETHYETYGMTYEVSSTTSPVLPMIGQITKAGTNAEYRRFGFRSNMSSTNSTPNVVSGTTLTFNQDTLNTLNIHSLWIGWFN